MTDRQKEFQKRILQTFRIEAEENVEIMSKNLVELEESPNSERREELFEILYRAAHSMKGASRAVGFQEIENLCHGFEDVMAAIRSEDIQFTSQTFDVLFTSSDLIEELINTDGEISKDLEGRIEKQLENLVLIESGLEPEQNTFKKSNSTPPPLPVKEGDQMDQNEDFMDEVPKSDGSSQNTILQGKSEGHIRVPTSKLDGLLSQAEELIGLKLKLTQYISDIEETKKNLTGWQKQIHTLNSLNPIETNGSKEGVFCEEQLKEHKKIHQSMLDDITRVTKHINERIQNSTEDSFVVNTRIDSLLHDIKELVMVPFSTMVGTFPRMIRDLSRDLGKEVSIQISGDSIEIDRRILEKMRNPLTHLLRNAIDHGIEPPEERLKNNKKASGLITLELNQLNNNKVEIIITDDGRGIDFEQLKRLHSHSDKTNLDSKKAVSQQELIDFMFKSGVSTNKLVTDLSGRGLGMSIVKDTIEELDGQIEVKSIANKSTSIIIQLPSSIVTFRGVKIKLGGSSYIIPTPKVAGVQHISENDIKTVEGKPTIDFNGQIIPLFSLPQVLGIDKMERQEVMPVINLKAQNRQAGFIVESILEEQEVLVKNFNKQIAHVKNIMGATVSSDGRVIPVLDPVELLESALTQNPTIRESSPAGSKQIQKKILIVEDSITSRTLIKNILESAGYLVTAAIDGVDGYTKLKEGIYDAVVTDVEMPRMDGFELTAKIRTNDQYKDLPVILVTSLSKREDRERGIDVGANAYIIKSRFDQNNLLEILQRLI